MKLGPAGNGLISLRCIGQSIGSEAELLNELHSLVTLETPSSPLKIQSLSFLDGVNHFAGPLTYETVYMKAKSDYVFSPLASSAIADLLSAVAAVPVGGIAVLCDAYGGQIGEVCQLQTQLFPGGTGHNTAFNISQAGRMRHRVVRILPMLPMFTPRCVRICQVRPT